MLESRDTVVLSNSEKEMLWVDGWNRLYDLVDVDPRPVIVDEAWRELAETDWQGLIQERAYDSQKALFSKTRFRGAVAIQVSFKTVG